MHSGKAGFYRRDHSRRMGGPTSALSAVVTLNDDTVNVPSTSLSNASTTSTATDTTSKSSFSTESMSSNSTNSSTLKSSRRVGTEVNSQNLDLARGGSGASASPMAANNWWERTYVKNNSYRLEYLPSLSHVLQISHSLITFRPLTLTQG